MSPPPGSTLPIIADRFGRQITYLRVSLTDRCNLRCVYCVPHEGFDHATRNEILSFEEIERIVRCFAQLGVRRVRLTGGEPTVRRGLPELAGRLAAIDGIQELCLTTNGLLLAELAAPLRRAGITTLNVSLDTLSAERFYALTRGGRLGDVLRGLDAATAAGYRGIKINVVGMRDINESELGALTRFAWEREALPRFIEWMPMSAGDTFAPDAFLSAAAMRAALAQQLGGTLAPDTNDGAAAPRGAGPARYWRHTPTGRVVGFISALTENFCDTCNRARLTASGELHACLARDDAVSLRDMLRRGDDDAALTQAILDAVRLKQEGHAFTSIGCGGPKTAMMAIGG